MRKSMRLEMARLQLRPLTPVDEAFFCDLYTDAETMRFIACPMSRKQALSSFRATLQAIQDPSGMRFFTIVVKAGACAVGVCAIQPLELDERRVEIGIMLAREGRQLRYATEILAALLGRTFATLPVDMVWVQYHPANAAAARLFARLGFLPECVAAGRPPSAMRTHCVSGMQRSACRGISRTTHRGQRDVEHHQFS